MSASPLSAFALERLAEAEAGAGKTAEAAARLEEAERLKRFVAALAEQARAGR